MIEIILMLTDAVRRADKISEDMMSRLENLAFRAVEQDDLIWTDFLAMSTLLDEARMKMGGRSQC